MEIISCPSCGSLKIFQGKMDEGVLTGYTFRYVCHNCGYQGMPIIFDKEKDYQEFLKNIKLNKKEKNEKIFNMENQKNNNILLKPPIGIIILSIIMIFQAIFSIYIYYITVGIGVTIWLWIYYISVFVISAIILPYGFLKGRSWAWTVGGILFAMSIPIGLIFLYYLTRPKVKIFFKKY